MKRIWFGIALLFLLLLLGITVTVSAGEVHRQISRDLTLAGSAARKGDWVSAGLLSARAEDLWQHHHNRTAVIADHEPMEEIDCLFAQLEVYLQLQDPTGFSACCAAMEVLVQAIGEAQSVSWWNLL